MTSPPGTQTITINILPDISKRKTSQRMLLIQLIEYDVRNVFQKLCRKWDRETSSRFLLLFEKL